MKQVTKETIIKVMRLPIGHPIQIRALRYIDNSDIDDIDVLFEIEKVTQDMIEVFNGMLNNFDEKKKKLCTIRETDSNDKISKKCRLARSWGIYYEPMWNRYVTPNDEAGNVYPSSPGPEQDDEFINNEAMSSTERMRRYNKRHPDKVRKYLKKTQSDRVARNRDRRRAVKKYGKQKMKNHDVHHPNGAQNGNWKLAKKDHGRDKKNK